jgi:hypothetical protein
LVRRLQRERTTQSLENALTQEVPKRNQPSRLTCPFLRGQLQGDIIKNIFDKELCEYVDLVLTGHDHSLQMLPSTKDCPKPLFAVSGTGATTTELKDKNQVISK